MIGLIGIIIAVALFIFMAFKGLNLVVSAIISTCIMIIFNGMPIYEVLIGTYVGADGVATGYMTYVAGCIKSYFLLFALSSLLGRIMLDGGAARKIALSCSKIVDRASEANKKLVCALMVPFLYIILAYVGISGFVIVFTVMPIAKELFESTNTPWKFYCLGGGQTAGVIFLAGSVQAANVYAAEVCGTSTTSGALFSIILYAVWIIATIILAKALMKKALANGETFLTDGAAVKNSSLGAVMPDEQLPNIWLSVIPLVLVIVLSAGFKVPVVPALLAGCVLAMIFLWKNIKSQWKSTLANGVTSCFAAVFTVAATYGMGSVIRLMPGFEIVLNGLDSLPGLFGGSALIMVMSFIMCDNMSAVAAFGSTALNSFAASGISPAIAHRMMNVVGFAAMSPHSPGIANAQAVTKIDYKKCLSMYMLSTFIPGICCTIVAFVLILLGIFH